MKPLKVTIITLTPELAAELLQKNVNNRPLKHWHIKDLAKKMKDGRWKFNGDTICISISGVLLNGQHRLHAVILSGVSISVLLVEGLDDNVFDTIDNGIAVRRGADALAILGAHQTKSLAAALCVVDRYMTGRLEQKVKYSNDELVRLHHIYGGMKDSVLQARATKQLLPPSILAACHYLFAIKDPIEADRFVEDLISGRNLADGDPVYFLRERLMNNSFAKAKLQDYYIVALMIKAWNFRRNNKTIRLLRFRQEGGSPESFPVII